jgi:flagellar hook-associated protein 2
MAAISSLGIGSGVLTQNVIDQLKAADTSAIIGPIQKNEQKNTTQQADLASLTALLSTLQSSASDLGTDTAYLKRSATSSSAAIKITASDGAQAQNATINVTQLANNDVIQSNGFSSNTSVISLTSGTLTLNEGTSNSYTIKTTVGMTLDQLVQAINDATSGNITASVLNTGATTNPYKLILKTSASGSDNKLSISEDSISTSLGLATPSISASSSADANAASFSAGDIKINGVSIGAFSTTNSSSSTNATQIMNAINLKTADTGVTAMTDSTGKLKLISDGRGIAISMTAAAQTATGFSSQNLVSNTQSYTATSAVSVPSTDTSTATGDIKINGTSISGVSLLASNSAEQNAQLLVTAINNQKTTTGVTAQTDGAGKLMLYAANGSPISLTLSNGASALSGLAAIDSTVSGTSYSKLQNAQNALFTYDGISMSRSSNTISDVMSGTTLTLVKTSAAANDGDANISITQDTSGFDTMVSSFVSAYNAVASKLSDLTNYDTTSGKGSTFSGVSEITSINSMMSSILTTQNSAGKSLMDYGFDIGKTGQLSVNSSTFDTAMAADPTAMETFFKGTNKITNAYYTANNKASTASGSTSPLGSIVINGVSIPAVTTTSTDAETNAQLFVTAINSVYSQTGVKAYTDGLGTLKFMNDIGTQINLTTTDLAASLSGISARTGVASGMSNAIVGYGKIESQNGVFANFNNMLKSLFVNNDSTLTRYTQSLTDQMTSLTNQQTSAQQNLDNKYTLMQSRFALYDNMISQYQQSFASLKQQISSASSSGG